MDKNVFLSLAVHCHIRMLPIRIALPTLTCMLLGPTAVIARDVLLDTFLDYISSTE